MEYRVYAGNGKTSPSGSVEAIDAGTVASLYGLDPEDYSVGTGADDFNYINLRPRLDGKYRNIKRALMDVENPTSTPAFFHKTRDGKTKNSRVVQPQYKPTFRDGKPLSRGERII